MTEEIPRTDDHWREHLTAAQFDVLRNKGTERPFTGVHLNNKADGVYVCVACETPLFTSDTKYDSMSGWPSFYQPVAPDAVRTEVDRSLGMVRVEVLCGTCDGHLGHVFEDGPHPTGQRYCINSVALDHVEDESAT